MRIIIPFLSILVLLTASISWSQDSSTSWKDTVFSGDFTYRPRFARTGEEGVDHRQRLRWRFGAHAPVSKDLDVFFQFSSGQGDPVSTTQTLGEGFTKKPLSLYKAYFRYQPLEGLAMMAGKMDNPLFRAGSAQLIWDSDLTPEGMALSLSHTFSRLTLFATGAAWWLSDRKPDDPDAWLLTSQAGLDWKTPTWRLRLAGGFSNFTGIRGFGPLFEGKLPGNSFGEENGETFYILDYNIVDVGIQLDVRAGNLPLFAYAQGAFNLAAEKENRAWLAGGGAGKLQEKGDVRLNVHVAYIQQDAVFLALSHSDFLGGAQPGQGIWGGITWKAGNNVYLSSAIHHGTRFLDNQDYVRLELDLMVKF